MNLLKIMQFACVVFRDELSLNRKRVKRIQEIKFNKNDAICIDPESSQDFNKNHKYFVKWYGCNKDGEACQDIDCEHPYQYCSAYIHFLAGKYHVHIN